MYLSYIKLFSIPFARIFSNFYQQTSVMTEQVALCHGYLNESQILVCWRRNMNRLPTMLFKKKKTFLAYYN